MSFVGRVERFEPARLSLWNSHLGRRQIWLILLVISLSPPGLAYEINQNFLVGENATRPLHTIYTRSVAHEKYQPIHELWLDLGIAAAPSSTLCPVSAEQVAEFVAPVPHAEISGYLCCGPGAESNLCGNEDARPGRDQNSLRRGVTWNDNPCHVSKYKYGPWAGLPKRYRHPNLSIRSHREDLQFLHAMADQDELARDTLRAMWTWAEFGYLVAIGRISPSSTLDAAAALLSPERAAELERRFPEPYGSAWNVGLLYSGVFRHQARQVQLLALGSVIHMLQDSYSDSHVQRDPPTFGPALKRPQLRGAGEIVAFRAFGDQRLRSHLEADQLPTEFFQQVDWAGGNELPVIATVADLIACAVKDVSAPGGAAHSWPEVERLLGKGPLATAPRFNGLSPPQNGSYD